MISHQCKNINFEVTKGIPAECVLHYYNDYIVELREWISKVISKRRDYEVLGEVVVCIEWSKGFLLAEEVFP